MDTLPYSDICVDNSIEFHKNIDVISRIGLCSSSLTLISTSIIVIFIFYKGIFSLPQIKPLLHLSIADFLLSYVWFSANLAYITKYDINHPKQEDNATRCLVWQLLAEIFHLITFGFTINYSINVYLQMRNRSYKMYTGYENRLEQIRRKLLTTERFKKALYYVFWFVPPLLLLPIIVNTKDSHICPCERCVILIDVPRLVHIQLFYKVYGFLLLAVCLALSFLIILVLYIFTLKLYWQTIPGYHTDRERRRLKNMQYRITLYVLVFTVCWIPALVISCRKSHEMLTVSKRSHGNSLRQDDVINIYYVYVLQAILTPLQGFLNTIVYGWSRKSFLLAARPTSDLTQRLMHNDCMSTDGADSDNRSLHSPIDSDVSFDHTYECQ